MECLFLLVRIYVIKLDFYYGKNIYDQEFKDTLVSLLGTRKTVSELSTEYGVSLASINR